MSDQNPADDAEKIRLKRLARLGGGGSQSRPSTPASSPNLDTKSKPKPQVPTTINSSPSVRHSISSQARTSNPLPDTLPNLGKRNDSLALNKGQWEENMIEDVFRVTLRKDKWEADPNYVWMKSLNLELKAERNQDVPTLKADDIDRVLISRLELNPTIMSDDPDTLAVLATLPGEETVFGLLTGCWKRLNTIQNAFMKTHRNREDLAFALPLFDHTRELIVSYIGLDMQDPSMFNSKPDTTSGQAELLSALLEMNPIAGPYGGMQENGSLSGSEVDRLIGDLQARFPTEEDGIDGILGPLISLLLFHPSLAQPEGLSAGDAGWRAILVGLELMVKHRPVCRMLARMPEWCPEDVNAANIETTSLLGPLSRLGVFAREWPSIAKSYFSNPQTRSRNDVDSSNSSLRSTLNTLQSALFEVMIAIVRSSPDAKEAVLRYFARVASLNIKRRGLQVDFDTVSSDSYLINLQSVLLRFAEPFLDSRYSKLERVDVDYLTSSSRLSLDDETRINATSDQIKDRRAELVNSDAHEPTNFITEIFYITATMNHYGLLSTIHTEQNLHKDVDDRQSMLDRLNADDSWQGTPMQGRVQGEIQRLKDEISDIYSEMFAFQVQLLDPGLVARNLVFIGFMATWVVRVVDPTKQHPTKIVRLPLPREVPSAFKLLPEFLIEDVADYYLYLIRNNPGLLTEHGKLELIHLCLTFLTSPWYIKNPFLKAKLVQVLFYGTLGFGRDSKGVLSDLLNSYPLCIEHLMPALTEFYIEIESTGSHTQFYDKFNARRDVAYILNAIWHTPGHRESLKHLSSNLDTFTRFINLMMNDVTFLLDESLSKLSEISGMQHEMEDPSWATQSVRHRQERQGSLRSLEGQATSWLALGKSTLDLLEKFTRETRSAFMVPEIVDRLAAMLTYNLDALVGPKCQDLKVKNPEKYKFNPRQLLSDILQVFLNLSADPTFIMALATEGRSYRQSLFDRAAGIAKKRALKTDAEIEQLRVLVEQVEQRRSIIQEEEEGDIPDEFLDPLMFTLMRDPVNLPSGAVIDRATIKSHLLSDATDPFTRQPLRIDEITPNLELKLKISQFLDDRREKRMQGEADRERLS